MFLVGLALVQKADKAIKSGLKRSLVHASIPGQARIPLSLSCARGLLISLESLLTALQRQATDDCILCLPRLRLSSTSPTDNINIIDDKYDSNPFACNNDEQSNKQSDHVRQLQLRIHTVRVASG